MGRIQPQRRSSAPRPLNAILPPLAEGEALVMGGEAKGKHVFPGQLQRETLQENKKLQLSNLDLFIMVKVKDQIMLWFSFQVLFNII